jgi:glycosyltransferase involved in cell wall biosynthesis
MATYNGERYLQQQLESIQAQTHPPDELVVGDDGSVDGTIGILMRFKQTAPFPVTVIGRERVGVTKNFLLSFDASQGNLVAFADQDDLWLPEKLQRSLKALHRYEADLVIHAAKPVDEQLRKTRASSRRVLKVGVRARLKDNVWSATFGNTILFRRAVLDGCDWAALPPSQWVRAGGSQPLAHDEIVKMLASVRGRTVRLPNRLVLYRQHGSNVAGADRTLLQRRREYAGHAASLEYRAQVAREWADYFSAQVDAEHQCETAAYFLKAADLMHARSVRLDGPAWRSVGSIGVATVLGEYSTRTISGFGWRALLQDLYHFHHRAAQRA